MNGVQYVTTHGMMMMLKSCVDNLDTQLKVPELMEMPILDRDLGLWIYGWIMLHVLDLRITWVNVLTQDGEGKTVGIIKMLELFVVSGLFQS